MAKELVEIDIDEDTYENLKSIANKTGRTVDEVAEMIMVQLISDLTSSAEEESGSTEKTSETNTEP